MIKLLVKALATHLFIEKNSWVASIVYANILFAVKYSIGRIELRISSSPKNCGHQPL